MKNFNSVGASGIVCDKGLFSSAKQKTEREWEIYKCLYSYFNFNDDNGGVVCHSYYSNVVQIKECGLKYKNATMWDKMLLFISHLTIKITFSIGVVKG